MKNSAPTYRSVDQLIGDITPDLATWLEPAVMTILASHMPHSTDWGGFFCEDFEGFTHGDFGDEQDWREHVAPLITAHIVKAIETDWERASAVCVINKPSWMRTKLTIPQAASQKWVFGQRAVLTGRRKFLRGLNRWCVLFAVVVCLPIDLQLSRCRFGPKSGPRKAVPRPIGG